MPYFYRGWGPRYYGYGAGLLGAALISQAYAPPPVVVVRQPTVITQTVAAAPQQAPVRPGHSRVNVTVPAGVVPGQNFTVNYGGNSFQIACPAGAFPGKQILIDVPNVAAPPVPAAVPQAAYAQQPQPQYAAPAPAAPPARYPPAYPAARPAPIPARKQEKIVVVKVPPGVKPGQEFDISHNGSKYTIPCPAGVHAGMEIEVAL